MECDISIYNSYNHNFFYDLEIGSYLIYISDHSGIYVTDSEATALLNIANSDKAFELIIGYENLQLNQKQKATFKKDNEISDSVYTTTIARDQALLNNWSIYVDETMIKVISFSLLQTLDIDDFVTVVWQLEPTVLPYSISTSGYLIVELQDYIVTDSTTVGQSLNTTVSWFGFDNTLGLVFVSLTIIIIVNLIMAGLKLELIISLIVNGSLLGLLSFIGFLPLWLLIGELIIIALGIMLKLGKGVVD